MDSVLHMLPKDVQLIVYRMVFDDYYADVLHEYAWVWLGGKFQWNDIRHMFIGSGIDGGSAANWRSLGKYVFDNRDPVYSFTGKRRGYDLPSRYTYGGRNGV